MKITILAYYFHPDQNIAAVRPENWATWLSEDHDVTVVTRECTDASEKAFPFQVLRPKSYGIRFLEWAKGCRDRLRSSKGTVKNIERKSQIQFGPQKISGVFHARMPSIHDLWFPACYSALKTTKPDIVIASYGPYVSLLAAYFYTMNHPTAKLWLDYRDFWTDHHISIGAPIIKIIEQFVENRCNSRADVISTIGKSHSARIGIKSEKDVCVVYNSPLTTIQNNNNLVQNKLAIAYTGTIYSGWQDPSPLFSLIKNWSKENIISADTFSLSIASKYPGNIHEILTHYDISDFVHCHGELSRTQSIELQQSSSLLLLLESSSPEAQGVLTGKVFEYLATDKPILLLGPGPDSELYQLLEKYGRLLTLENLKSIVEKSLPIPICKAVDFREISKKQLFAALKTLQ